MMMKNILLKSALTLLLALMTVTGWGQAPTIKTLTPSNGSTNVSLTPNLQLEFTTNVVLRQLTSTGKNIYIKRVSDNNIVLTIAIKGGVATPNIASIINSNTLSINLTSSTLDYGTSYYVEIENGAIRHATLTSTYFAGISGSATWSFTTIAPPPSAPDLVSIYPESGTYNIDRLVYLSASFDKTITLGFGSVSLYKSDGTLVGSYTTGDLVLDDKTFEIYDDIELEYFTDYYVLIDGGLIGNSGLFYSGISDPAEWTFRTVAAPLTSDPNDRDPLDNATDVAIDKTLSITFSEPIEFTGSGLVYVKNLTDVNNFGIYDNLSPELSISGSTLSINPTGSFANSIEYEVTIDADFVASSATGATNSEISGGAWTFTTVVPPSPITTLTPADASTNISIDTDVSIDFDQPVRYINNSSIASNPSYLIVSFTGADGHTLTAADYLIEVNATNDGATLTLLTQLHENVLYTVVVRQVENSNDIAQSGDYTSTFKTALSAKWLGLSSAWDVTSNWSTAVVPDNTTSVVIQKAGSYDPIIANNVAADINSMTINADASLTIDGSLRVREGLTLKSSASKNASLLNNGTLTVTSSKVKIQQVVTNPAWDYYISSPVSGATPANIGFVGTVYERLANSWGTVGSGTTLTNAKGYVGIPTSATTLVYKGTINNGSYSFTGQRTTSPNNYGWSLAGNPYPCSIDWQSASLTKTNLTNGFWVYLNDSQRWGTYGGDAGLGVNVDDLAPSLIPSGHAFYVQVIIGQTSGNLGIAPGSRVNNTVSYLKAAENSVAKPVLRLEGVNGSLKDELAVAFIDGAADTFDSFDSQKQTSSNPDLLQVFTLAGTTRCAINSFSSSSLANSNTISLGYTASVAGTFNLLLKSITGFPDNVIVSLEDAQKGVMQEVSSGDSYSFTTTAKTDVTRFKIHFSQSVVTDAPSDNEMSEKISTYVSDHILFVKVSTTESASYELIDANGQLVSGGNLLPDTFNRIVSSKNGVFVFKVITNQGVYCKKVLIN